MDEADHKKTIRRLKIIIQGAVQGVGFRPFVFRLATLLSLNGWVINSSQGVVIEVEGSFDELNTFLLKLEKEKPSLASIASLEFSWLDPVGFSSFEPKIIFRFTRYLILGCWGTLGAPWFFVKLRLATAEKVK